MRSPHVSAPRVFIPGVRVTWLRSNLSLMYRVVYWPGRLGAQTQPNIQYSNFWRIGCARTCPSQCVPANWTFDRTSDRFPKLLLNAPGFLAFLLHERAIAGEGGVCVTSTSLSCLSSYLFINSFIFLLLLTALTIPLGVYSLSCEKQRIPARVWTPCLWVVRLWLRIQ